MTTAKGVCGGVCTSPGPSSGHGAGHCLSSPGELVGGGDTLGLLSGAPSLGQLCAQHRRVKDKDDSVPFLKELRGGWDL